MEGNLVIVESPGKVKTIGKYLGEGFTVKASIGHIRDLQEKKLSIDLEHGFAPEYVVPAGKKAVVSELKKLADKAETVWLASDEDREGEAISWHLSETLGLDPAKTRRIVFHEITKTAIQEAIKHPRDIDMNLVNAQQARRVLDRLVGFELSPVLWRKIKPQLSAGRVQSVALKLITDREKEIMAFEKTPYYRVEGMFGTSGSAPVKAVLDRQFRTEAEAGQFLNDCIGATFTVGDISSKEGSRTPAAPFTTSTLQQEAARVLHLPVNTTMKIAQGLYERGLITYMRTDSVNLSEYALMGARKFILDTFGDRYHRWRQYKTKSKGAQEAHEAIRPTEIGHTAIEGTPQEQKLYNLIWKRTVASQMSDAAVLNTSVRLDIDRRSEKFEMQSYSILFDGFLKVYQSPAEDEEETDNINIPEFRTGDVLIPQVINADSKFTSAPARYSEQTLVKKLDALEIGRPSTYAQIIGTLTTGRGYVIKGDKEGTKVEVTNLSLTGNTVKTIRKTEVIGAEKGRLLPQEIGMVVSDYLAANFPDIMNYDFTADVEKDFDRIADGELAWNSVIADFYTPFHQKVHEVTNDGQYNKISREIGAAPDGEVLIAKFGQYGAYIQKGAAEKKQFASLGKGQLIENITLEEALKLFMLPRTVGQYEGIDIIATKGRFGPFIKYGDKNVSLPKGADPLSVTLDECIRLICDNASKTPVNTAIAEFKDSDISIMNGRYGPYLKHAGQNYKIPAGTDPASLDEETCKAIVSSSQPTAKGRRRFARKK